MMLGFSRFPLGEMQTVKLFINENSSLNKVYNVKFLWNDWFIDKGFGGVHADKEEAEKAVQALIKLYAPDKSEEIRNIFFGNVNKTISTSRFIIEYTYERGPAIDERMIIVTEKPCCSMADENQNNNSTTSKTESNKNYDQQDYAELGEFVKIFMINEQEPSNVYDWRIGTEANDLPIKWISNGIESEELVNKKTVYFRKARAKIKVNGVPITELLDIPKPIEWDIKLYSKWDWDKSPERVEIQPDDKCFSVGSSGCSFDVVSALNKAGIKTSFLCEYSPYIGNGIKIYLINATGKKDAISNREHEFGQWR